MSGSGESLGESVEVGAKLKTNFDLDNCLGRERGTHLALSLQDSGLPLTGLPRFTIFQSPALRGSCPRSS